MYEHHEQIEHWWNERKRGTKTKLAHTTCAYRDLILKFSLWLICNVYGAGARNRRIIYTLHMPNVFTLQHKNTAADISNNKKPNKNELTLRLRCANRRIVNFLFRSNEKIQKTKITIINKMEARNEKRRRRRRRRRQHRTYKNIYKNESSSRLWLDTCICMHQHQACNCICVNLHVIRVHTLTAHQQTDPIFFFFVSSQLSILEHKIHFHFLKNISYVDMWRVQWFQTDFKTCVASEWNSISRKSKPWNSQITLLVISSNTMDSYRA